MFEPIDFRDVLANLERLHRDVLSDQMTFNRRRGQLSKMLADCAAIRAALADGEEEERPA
jgi:hypothetical protein